MKTDPANLGQDWLAWLKQGDCLPWLREQAWLLLRQAGAGGLPPSLWPYGRLEALSPAERDSALEEIAHELWIFMRLHLERRAGGLPPELDQAQRRPHLVAAYFRNGFLFHLRSRARRKETSPYHYLYRRLRELVSQGRGFFPRPGLWGALYSLEAEGESLNSLHGLVEDYAAWPSPLALVSENRLLGFHAADLDVLARYFWREAVARLGRPCFIACRELAVFLASHYRGLDPAALAEEFAADGAGEEESGLAEVRISGLAVLARQLLAGWSEVRRQVFALALDDGDLTLQQVAERAGLQGPSHARYHLQQACQDLAHFCEAWPGVSPAPSDRAFWTEFLYCVAAACKNSRPDRLGR